jgi:hypothetical protein
VCARVLKVKYFPNLSCLQARPNEGISYTCRSILKGLTFWKRGSIVWRIGDAEGIDMWKDPWLPKDHTRRANYSSSPGPTFCARFQNSLTRSLGTGIFNLSGIFSLKMMRRWFWPSHFGAGEHTLAWHILWPAGPIFSPKCIQGL